MQFTTALILAGVQDIAVITVGCTVGPHTQAALVSPEARWKVDKKTSAEGADGGGRR